MQRYTDFHAAVPLLIKIPRQMIKTLEKTFCNKIRFFLPIHRHHIMYTENAYSGTMDQANPS